MALIADREDALLDGHASFVLHGANAELLFAIARTVDGFGIFEVAAGTVGLNSIPLPTFDHTLRLAELTFADAPARRLGSGAAGGDGRKGAGSRPRRAGRRTGRRGQAGAGVHRRLRQDARPVRPAIGSFQAIKHMAADLLLESESPSPPPATPPPRWPRARTTRRRRSAWPHSPAPTPSAGSPPTRSRCTAASPSPGPILPTSICAAPAPTPSCSGRPAETRTLSEGVGSLTMADGAVAPITDEACARRSAPGSPPTGSRSTAAGPGGAGWTATPEHRAWLAKVVDARWAVPRWPAEWYGRGLSDAQARIVEREFAEVGAPGTGQDRTNLWANTALAYAGPMRSSQDRAACCESEVGMCLLYSEPGAGSDLAGIRTRAERRGRPLRRQRPEGLDLRRRHRRLRHADRPHRLGRAQAPGHQLLLPADEADRASRCGRCARSPTRAISTRCSSPMPSCRRRTCWAR